MIQSLILAVCLFGLCSASVWPVPGVTLCHRSHPDFVECLNENIPKGAHTIRNGIKEIGFPKVDPVKAPSPFIINVDNGGQMALTMKLINCYLDGATTNAKIVKGKFDFDNDCSWSTDVDIPVLDWYGEYALQGKLLMFQLNGHGKCNFTLRVEYVPAGIFLRRRGRAIHREEVTFV
ncbi:unnamed protein product [Acanthoscelides obtectus]|uniref:Uncharacterized protein n=1 Tax=Acanthoscelides obtectus TaxID=200917 RepID=A0A9P0KAE7_ACAOB|nr:unnamed protein product [Acanthoscelides obtectus]CAK1662563.1 hypothetical protein AOBTE_LOCUS23213 [Acanthoscelides obtectus]